MKAPGFFRGEYSYLPYEMRQARQAEDDARWMALTSWQRLKWRATIYALWSIGGAIVLGIIGLFWWLDRVRFVVAL